MAGEPERRRLRRSDDRMIGGVCAGIAEYLALDPTVVRVIFALLFILGVGVSWLLVYVVLWVIMPEAAEGEAGASEGGRAREVARGGVDAGVVFGILLLGVGLMLLGNQFALSRFFGFGAARMAWPLLLIAIGAVAILVARDQSRR